MDALDVRSGSRPDRISPDAHPGAVLLRVHDLDRSLAFHAGTLGLEARSVRSVDGRVRTALSPPTSTEPVLVLEADPKAERPAGPGTGLFHLALLLPRPTDLGRLLRHLQRSGTPLLGAFDHLVREAIYVVDPEGNRIELSCDRPPERWPRSGGEIGMSTESLDVASVLARAEGEPAWFAFPAGGRLGHVHLRVSSLTESGTFYREGLGLEVTNRSTPGALFLAAGDYHHHVALNVWDGEGLPPSPPGAAGLVGFTFIVPGARELWATYRRLVRAGYEPRREGRAELEVSDPNGVAVRIVAHRR